MFTQNAINVHLKSKQTCPETHSSPAPSLSPTTHHVCSPFPRGDRLCPQFSPHRPHPTCTTHTTHHGVPPTNSRPWQLARLPTPTPPIPPYSTLTHAPHPTPTNPTLPHILDPTPSPRPNPPIPLIMAAHPSHNPAPPDPLCRMIPALMGCPQWTSAEMACTKHSQYHHSMSPETRPSGSQYMQEMSINAINVQTECKESHPQIIHPNTSPCRETLSPQLTPPQSTPPSTSHPPPSPAFHSRCFSPYTLESQTPHCGQNNQPIFGNEAPPVPLIYAIGAGITAAAGTRLALQLPPVPPVPPAPRKLTLYNVILVPW